MLINKHTVAIIDSNRSHQEEVKSALLSFYVVQTYSDVNAAISDFSLNLPAIILVGEELEKPNGLDIIRALRQEESLKKNPVIYIVGSGQKTKIPFAINCGANGYIEKPYLRSALIRSISDELNANVEKGWESLPETPRRALKGTIEAFNKIADVISSGKTLPYGMARDACLPLVESIKSKEYKIILEGLKDHDNYTYVHSMRVATLLSLFGYTIGLNEEDQLLLASGGLLHDVGKMTIPHIILNKPGVLDKEEMAIMRTHVPETVKYLKAVPEMPEAVIIIAGQHHEKINGTGYPNGLKDSQLNDLARMAAIVDIFSALTDRRVYKPPMKAEEALRIMTNDMKDHIDQRFLGIFKTMLLEAVEG